MPRLIVLIIFVSLSLSLQAETTITYQGQLQDADGPYSGIVDMSFELFDAETAGSSVGPMLERDNVTLEEGLFQVELDFGDQPYETGLYLEVRVDGQALEPRQPIHAAPLAIRSLSGDGNGGDSVWSTVGDDIHYTVGNVAIGTTDPGGDRLRVEGSLVTGESSNVAGNSQSAVIGGNSNTADGNRSFVGGGRNSLADGNNSFIAGGRDNEARFDRSFVGGGAENIASGLGTVVTGGFQNELYGRNSFIAAGTDNRILSSQDEDSEYSAIVGGTENRIGTPGTPEFPGFVAESSAIVGGQDNLIMEDGSFIGGGWANEVSGERAAVVGGLSNSVEGPFSTILGGSINSVEGNLSAILGGTLNSAEGSSSIVAGGSSNAAEGFRSAVVGGGDNTASGDNAFIGGGSDNTADAENTFAAGSNARALHDNSFVWSAGGSTRSFGAKSTAENQFVVAATGSVRFISDDQRSIGVELAPGGSAWNVVSDRNAKTAIHDTDPREVLERVMALPISEYSYISQDDSIRHMGPMAQDFHPLFGLGEDELRISAMNLAGISLAAIQGLYAELEERITKLEAENAELRKLAERNDQLEDRLATLEALLLGDRRVAEAEQ